MQFYVIVFYTVIFFKHTSPERSVDVGFNKNLPIYFRNSHFDREEKGNDYKTKWYAKIRSRRPELSGGSVRVNGRQIYETLLNEIVELGTNNGTSVLEGSVTSAAEEGNKGGEVEFEWKTREDAFRKSMPEEYPYSVLLLMYSSKNFSLGSCTGSLLSASWVLTVAHCVSKKVSHVLVYAGGQDKQEVKDQLPANTSQTLRSLRIYRHPRFSSSKGYDVALIRVDGNFSLTAYVNVVRLSTRPWSHRGYVTCEVTAFGVVRAQKSSPDDAARKTHRLRVKKPCYCSYRLRMQAGARAAQRFICTQPKEDYGLCSGDSGSALVCGGEIRGLTTSLVQMFNMDYCILNKWPRKFACASKNTLTVFISTCPFLSWINSHVTLFNSTEISRACVKAAASHTVRNITLYTVLTSLFVSLGLACEFNKIIHIV